LYHDGKKPKDDFVTNTNVIPHIANNNGMGNQCLKNALSSLCLQNNVTKFFIPKDYFIANTNVLTPIRPNNSMCKECFKKNCGDAEANTMQVGANAILWAWKTKWARPVEDSICWELLNGAM
jgi:hypothetical protein